MSFRNGVLMLAIAGLFLPSCAPAGGGSSDNDNVETNDNDNTVPANDNGTVNTNDNGNDNDMGSPPTPTWNVDFDASDLGFLSTAWGSAPDDVFMVGGQPTQGEIYHFDGDTWQAMNVPVVPRLIWVFGFGPDNVYAVGEDGGAVHYDGQLWSLIETGTTEDLWGVWGNSPTDIWIVGGTASDPGPGLIFHYDGCELTPMDLPINDRNSTSLFKVWGIGSKVFAVGAGGLIIELDPVTREWSQIPTPGATEDYIALWGTSEDNIVVVGGRAVGQIGIYDGESWTTIFPPGVTGLNGVYMVEPDEAIIGGINGIGGSFNPMTEELEVEFTGTGEIVHGIWGDGTGRFRVAGGTLLGSTSNGLSLVRTLGDAEGTGEPPEAAPTLPPAAAASLVLLDDDASDVLITLEDGDDLPFFMGIQGGRHIEPRVRLIGFPEGSDEVLLSLSYSLRLIETDQVISSLDPPGFALVFPCGQNDIFEMLSRQFVFDFTVTEEDADDQMAEFTCTLSYAGPAEDPLPEPVEATITQTFRLFFAGADVP